MAIDVEPNMGLHRWNLAADVYDYTLDLIADKNRIGAHTHGGAPTDGLPVKAIANGTLAARPAAAIAGKVYFATDAHGGLGSIAIDTGSAWLESLLLTATGGYTALASSAWDFSAATTFKANDPAILGIPYVGTTTQNLPSVASSVGKHRQTKAWGGSLTINPATGEQLVPPGATAANAVNAGYTSPNGESVDWWCITVGGNTYWWGL